MEEEHDQTGMPETTSSSQHPHNWIPVQEELKKRLAIEDDFTWEIPSPSSSLSSSLSPPSSCLVEEGMRGNRKEMLKYVGGVDISFLKEDPSIACGTFVVLDLQSLKVVYDDFSVVRLHIPYVPGFLAFREAPLLLMLLEKMKKNAHPFYPQLLMVDGNGLLHPRGFGLACHLGVLADLPTVGVGKNLHHVEGLTQSEVKKLLEVDSGEDFVYLVGHSGRTLGVAMRSSVDAVKPIFISIGHRISLASAIKIVKMTCKFRVPEPIRQADIRSREHLRKHPFLPSAN